MIPFEGVKYKPNMVCLLKKSSYLGLNNKSKGTVFINQYNYIEQVINRFNMEKANPSSTKYTCRSTCASH